MNLPQLPPDKANHALYGAAIFIACGFAATRFGFPAEARVIGAACAMAAGALKELSDHLLNRRAIAAGLLPPHGVEFLDFAATTAGGLACWVAAVATGG